MVECARQERADEDTGSEVRRPISVYIQGSVAAFARAGSDAPIPGAALNPIVHDHPFIQEEQALPRAHP